MRATTISALVVAVGLLALDVVVAADPCASRTSCAACVHASCAWQYMAGVSNVGQCVPVAAGRSAAVTVVDAGQCPSSLQMALESTIVPQIGALCLLFLAATGIAVHMFVGRMRAMLASDAVADAQNGTQELDQLHAVVPNGHLSLMLKAASDTLQEPLIWVGLPYTDQAPYSAQHRHRYVYYLLLVCILVSATASLAIYVDGVMPVVLNARLAVHIAQLVSLAVGCLAAVVCVALVIVGRRRALSWAYAVTESHAIIVSTDADPKRPTEISLAFDKSALAQITPVTHANGSRSFLFDLSQAGSLVQGVARHTGFWHVHFQHAEIVQQMLYVILSGRRVRQTVMQTSRRSTDSTR
ncbi:PSI domain-containing protein [Plasmodiophora brassicae]